MAYNPAILQSLLRARSISRANLSARLGLATEVLDEELARDPEPKQGILNSIARELALPSFVFYMAEAPHVEGVIPDFRLPQPAPTAKTRQTVEAIQLAQSIQRICEENDAPEADRLPSFGVAQRRDIEGFALQVREFFGISLADQQRANSARDFYVICRKKIESRGIFVLHESFPAGDGSGFCLASDNYPIVVINTQQQTRGRRLFTLAHEIGHVLLNETGISDPFVQANAIETWCNKFAAAFLAPAGYVQHLIDADALSGRPSLEDIKKAAQKLKISQQATVLRLETLGLVQPGSHERWLNLIHNLGNPDYSERGGGGREPPPQEKVKLAKYGFRFARIFGELLDEERISEINLYRATGLKPKYQRPYIDYTNALNDDELNGAELEDE